MQYNFSVSSNFTPSQLGYFKLMVMVPRVIVRVLPEREQHLTGLNTVQAQNWEMILVLEIIEWFGLGL